MTVLPNFWLDPKVAKDQGRRPLGYSIELSAEGLKLASLKQQSFFFAPISIELNAVGLHAKELGFQPKLIADS